MASSNDTIKEILSEIKKLKEADRQLLLKELKIRRLGSRNTSAVLATNKPELVICDELIEEFK
jgi:hypothetical protein